jgi:hypothetical protein
MQTLTPDLVMVVDASDVALRADLNSLRQTPGLKVEAIYTEAGLPNQRNTALVALSDRAEFVHFFDDDVELDKGYLKAIDDEFSRNQRLVGASGDVINAHPPSPKLIQRVLLLKSLKGGVVLSSGVNIGMPGQHLNQKIMWLPGCAMSYRLSALKGMAFDVSRGGYALGEDVDFSARVGLQGDLAFIPAAKVIHKFATTNRLNPKDLARDDVASRWRLASQLPYVKRTAVAYSTIGHALLYYATSFQSEAKWQRQAANSRLTTLWSLITGRN